MIVALATVTRGLRGRDRLTQQELARRAGLSANFIGAVEHGRANPTVTRIGQLAHGLGLGSARELLRLVEDTAQRLAAAIQATPGPPAT